MPERESQPGGPNRKRTGDDKGYEVDDLAKKFGLSNDQASRLIRQIGSDRAKLEAAAEKLTKR